MKKLLTSIAVATAMMMPTLPAQAACIHVNEDFSADVHQQECEGIIFDQSEYNFVGGCNGSGFDDQIAGQGQVTGEIDVEMGVYSANPTHNPVSASVTCYILVNGAPQPGAVVSASGTVVVLGGGVITFTSDSETDFIQLCTRITYHGPGGNQTVNFCSEDFFRADLGIICAFLRQFAGTWVGDVYIDWDGDVWYGGFRVIDCPPTGN